MLTKDPAKLKVYTDGFDSHCVNAAAYFRSQMPDIDPNSVESVNSIKDKYPGLRQKSKAVTFAAQYGGTFRTFMDAGFTEQEAKEIEKNYHELYKVSDDWTQSRIQEASKLGYATTAFGLRIRTPILKQVLLGQRNTPYEASAEARTIGNAISGQAFGLLNNRAGVELQERTFLSDYRYDIMPVAHVHDAAYFIVKDDIDVVRWFNNNIAECMSWQELPEIQHPEVGLSGELDIFYEGWHKPITLPNFATPQEILNICKSA